MRRATRTLRSLVPLALLAAGLTAVAGGLPNLPKGKPLPQGPDSPGVVTFRHETHVDAGAPDCTTCHPKLFPILKRTAAQKPLKITHDAMTKKQLCGSCHDGTSAHGLDDCGTCHEPAKE